jgi:hypothetical protein
VTIDERLEALTARHEALTMNMELMQQEGLKFRIVLRRWSALAVHEGPKHRRQIAELNTASGDHRQRIAELEAKSAIYQARTDQNLAEIADKLNGLIGCVDGKRQ